MLLPKDKLETSSPPVACPAPGPGARALTFFLSLVLALFVAEAALRLAAPAHTRHYMWPPGMFHEFRPRPDLFPDLGPTTRFSVNPLGLRGAETRRDEEELRVVAFGGSTTECIYQDDQRVWTHRIGAILSEGNVGRPVWSAGGGRSGMNSGDHVLHVKYLLKELPRMDVVLILAGVNDVNVALGMPDTYMSTPASFDPEKHEKALRRAFAQVPGRLESSWDYDSSFLKQSAIFQLLRRVRRQRSHDLATHHLVNDDTGSAMLRWRGHRLQATRIVNELPDLTKALATYRQNLHTIADLVAERGSRLVFLTQPTLWRADLDEEEQKLLWMGGIGDYQKNPGHEYYSVAALAEAMRRFNEVMLEVCRDRGTGCVDLAAEIPKTGQIFYDDCHFGHAGSERIAQTVAAYLTKEPALAR